MKTENQTRIGSDTMRWLKRVFTPSRNKSQTDEADIAAANHLKVSKVVRNGKTVLVVDDDPVFLKAATMKLESEGYNVITALEGAEAIQAARKTKPDLLVLDVNLTRDVAGVPWDGFSVIAWLRRFEDMKNIPVVIATSGDPANLAKKAFSAGASAFYHKRMDPRQLIALVSRSLQQPRLAVAGAGNSFQI
jgi:CheY-like chemotaxis protein